MIIDLQILQKEIEETVDVEKQWVDQIVPVRLKNEKIKKIRILFPFVYSVKVPIIYLNNV